MQYYYGFDISTVKIGISIINENEQLVFDHLLKLKSEDELEIRAEIFENLVSTFFKKFPPKKVVVEAALVAANKSNAHTIAKLQRFNGICCYILYKLSGKLPTMVSAITARNRAGIKVERIKKKVKTAAEKRMVKETVIKFVADRFKNFTYKLTKQSNFAPGTDDIADAIVLSLYGLPVKLK